MLDYTQSLSKDVFKIKITNFIKIKKQITNNRTIIINIWNSDLLLSVQENVINKTNVIIIIYSLDNSDSFKAAEKQISLLNNSLPKSTFRVLIGINKDKIARKVITDQGKN